MIVQSLSFNTKRDGINISGINSMFLQDLKIDKHVRKSLKWNYLRGLKKKKGAVTEEFKLTDIFHFTELCLIQKVQ